MQAELLEVWKYAPVVAILALILWTGHRGYWYWSPGVRALTSELARDRDDWRALAVVLLRKQGVDLPEGFESSSPIVLPGEDRRK